jgi:putative ABC transport system substrate-binding protein
MRRIGLAVILAVSLVLAPLAVEAQQQTGKIWRIGVLSPGAPGYWAPLEAFRQGLRGLGYIEGGNTIIDERFAVDRTDRLTVLARDLVQAGVDVIFAINTPASLAAKKATATIPIVVTRVSDPIGAGLVASLAHPGGNVTGLTTVSPELSGKRLELLHEALPWVQRIVIIWNSANTGHAANVKEMEAAGPRLRLQVSALGVRREEDLSSAIQTAVNTRAGVLVVIDDLVISSFQPRILDMASKHKLPVVSQFREFCEAGGLMAYGPNNDEMFRRAATYIDKIFKGAKPGDLPVEQPTKFELVINLKTAKALGLTIPPSVLGRADQVIE